MIPITVRELSKNSTDPSIRDLINHPMKDKDNIVGYMKRSAIVAAFPGRATDILDSAFHSIEMYLMNDGTYEWRSEIIYYAEKYDMAFPDDFVRHVLDSKPIDNYRKSRHGFLSKNMGWRKES